MRLESLNALYQHELKDLRDAEDQLVRMLPRMAEAASDDELKEHFSTHGKESRDHRARIDQLLEDATASSNGVQCAGMRGILEEAERLIDDEGVDPSVRDVGLLAIAQKTEHYEMASYGALRTFAQLLGQQDSAKILQQNLDEEGSSDDRLNRIAQRSVNPAATG